MREKLAYNQLKRKALAAQRLGCWQRRKLGMPDYIQLLESKLSPNQKQALNAITDVARSRGITVFLTGGAVRDLVSGASVRDLDITVQANPLKFRKDLEKAGFALTGEHEPSQTLYLRYGGQARLEISASRAENFPKPGRPEYRPAAILDDLRRRDFTANAMALSLNEGSWGLLLDPLNGMADIYARQLRLVSNYGFLEDPIRMIRAVRLLSRTGWEMEERTKTRYENAKAEGVISALTATHRGYELEEIAYEEEPLQILKVLESEGWMEHLSPTWTSRSVDSQGMERLHERLVKLLMAGLHPDPSAAQFRLLTAKMTPAHLSALKRLFLRSDLIAQADALDREAKKALQQISAKDAAKPSQLWRLLHSMNPEAVLWLFFTGKGAPIQNKFENFFTKWPEARQKIPNAVLQDMRITPDVSGYDELLDKLTFAYMDDELPNEEAVRKFAAPYSPPAPPPPVTVRRGRAVKRVVEPKGKKGKKAAKPAAPVTGAEQAPAGDVAAVEPAAATPAAKAGKAIAAATKKDSGKKEPAVESKTAAAKPAMPAKNAARPAARKAPAVSAKPSAKTVAPAHKNGATAKAGNKPSKAQSATRPAKNNTAAKAVAKTAAKKAVAPGKTQGKKTRAATGNKAAKKAPAAKKSPAKPAAKKKATR